MLSFYYKSPVLLEEFERNRLHGYLEEMAEFYRSRSYPTITAQNRLRPAANFGLWMEKRQISIADITPRIGSRFLESYIAPKYRKTGRKKGASDAARAGVLRMVNLIIRDNGFYGDDESLAFYYKNPLKLEELKRNCLHEQLEEMASFYKRENYTPAAAFNRLRPAAYFGDWLDKRRIPVRSVTREIGQRFLRSYVAPRYRARYSRKKVSEGAACGISKVIKLIHERFPPVKPEVPHELEIERFSDYLRNHRGLRENTIRTCGNYVRHFLVDHFGDSPVRLEKLAPSDVHDHVMRYAANRTISGVKNYVAGLRSYFRYRKLHGLKAHPLLFAMPRFRLSRPCLSQTIISDKDMTRIEETFDRSSATNRRDYAIFCVFRDYGARMSDVSNLSVDDVHWRESLIRMPNQKVDDPIWLPLSDKVGEALADYIRNGRPPTKSRHIFLRHNAPRGIPGCAQMIGGAMKAAFARAGLEHRYSGTHIFRHTIATLMRRNGVSLKAAADVLGHHTIRSTMLYSQVDQPALSAVAQPWPEGRP
jgi:site-specific recombinase XerD